MIKIINEINGKKYELERYCGVSIFDSCKLCDLREQCPDDAITDWDGYSVCDVLNGFWKKVDDVD